MASLTSITSVLSKICGGSTLTSYGFQQIRSKWTKAKTLRDMKRRQITKEYAPERLRLLCLKRNDVLPVELREDASKVFTERIPRVTGKIHLTRRCVVTSRGYGTVYRWRLSRFVFRHLADYNKMAGVQRAMW